MSASEERAQRAKDKEMQLRQMTARAKEMKEQDYPNVEIANAMGISENYVRNLLAPRPVKVIFDSQSKNWTDDPQINMLFLRTQENWANDLLRARGHVFLNEIHDMLGVPRTTQGQLEGWLCEDQKSYASFGISFGLENKEFDSDTIELEFYTEVIYDKIEEK